MAPLSVIRRWHPREVVSIREVARRTKLSLNATRKNLADGALEAVCPKCWSPSKLFDGAVHAELQSSVRGCGPIHCGHTRCCSTRTTMWKGTGNSIALRSTLRIDLLSP